MKALALGTTVYIDPSQCDASTRQELASATSTALARRQPQTIDVPAWPTVRYQPQRERRFKVVGELAQEDW